MTAGGGEGELFVWSPRNAMPSRLRCVDGAETHFAIPVKNLFCQTLDRGGARSRRSLCSVEWFARQLASRRLVGLLASLLAEREVILDRLGERLLHSTIDLP